MVPGNKSASWLVGLMCLGLFLPLWLAAQNGSPLINKPSDPTATPKTKALFDNLRNISGKWILFGHQDDMAYGVHWKGQPGRSDVLEVCGTYPSVFGWDVGELVKGATHNIDSVPFRDMQAFMLKAFKLGSVNTISWHLDNLGTGGSAWDTTTVVRDLLPGGQYHDRLLAQLDVLADYLKTLKTQGPFRRKIPIIFRPWHENTGHWFWWGSASCTSEEFKALWRFTVDYLREEKRIHNLLYAFSPSGNFASPEEYLQTYPGDDYVDILGVDYYYSPDNMAGIKTDLGQKLAIISRLAAEKGKISALTETGFEAIPDSSWWTAGLLDHIESTPDAGRIAYLLVWRNAWEKSRLNHYYAPYPGQVSSADFVRFTQHPRVALNNKMPNMYRKPRNRPAAVANPALKSTSTTP